MTAGYAEYVIEGIKAKLEKITAAAYDLHVTVKFGGYTNGVDAAYRELVANGSPVTGDYTLDVMAYELYDLAGTTSRLVGHYDTIGIDELAKFVGQAQTAALRARVEVAACAFLYEYTGLAFATAKRIAAAVAQETDASVPEVQPSRLCWQVARTALLLLPTEHQPRYTDEWRADFWHLGRQARPRWRQLCYALRLLASSLDLRRSLTETISGRAHTSPGSELSR